VTTASLPAGAAAGAHPVSPRELLKVFKSSNSESVPDATVDSRSAPVTCYAVLKRASPCDAVAAHALLATQQACT
jgi:hypothetical protein